MFIRGTEHRKKVIEKGYFNVILYSYLFTTFIVLPALLIYTIWFLNQIASGFAEGMTEKLQKFGDSKVQRFVFNSLQFDYECCGAKGYKDWEKVYEDKSVPFSCCKRKILGFCQNKGLNEPKKLETINTDGCAKIFHTFILNRMYGALGLWLLILFVHSLSLLFFQFWKSSAEAAMKSGNPKKKSEGWIWLPFVGVYKELVKDFKTKYENFKKESKPLLSSSPEGSPNSSMEKSVKRMREKIMTTKSSDSKVPFDQVLQSLPDLPSISILEYLPQMPPISPRYDMKAPEMYNQMTRHCHTCNRLTFPTGNHLCIPFSHNHSTAMMAITDDDLTDAEDSDSSSDNLNQRFHEKNYKNSPLAQKSSQLGGQSSKIQNVLSSKMDPTKRMSIKATTTTDEDTDKLDALKRKYKERYYILKEIR